MLHFFVFFLYSISSFAQKNTVISGKVVTEKDSPIESATIYLMHPKDFSIVVYTLSDKNGHFKLETKSGSQNNILKISAEGYLEFSDTIEKPAQNIDLGVVRLMKYDVELDEVIIKNEAPIRIKKDTIEFNASSFKLRPDANVEALLKELPGVTIDMNKKIMVNGKKVNQILVNGKPFFDADGKIALQNLPAELIKKVQVSDTKTKEQEFTKQASTSENVSINLTIDKKKNKGFFGKLLGGYGSSERYESSALLSYFKDKRRISFLASSNNINASGFSMNEVFDNMGGGRNDGSGGSFGSRGGIIKSNMIGISYTDEWFKGESTDLNYYFNNSNADNTNKTSELTLLPTGSLLSKSASKSDQDSNRHNVSLNFEYKVSPSIKVFFAPAIQTGKTVSVNAFDRKTLDENNQLINSSNSFNTTQSNNTNFRNNLRFFLNAKKEGRYFTASFENDNSRNDLDSRVNSLTIFAEGTSPDDLRNQNVTQKNNRDKYIGNLQYFEPVTDSLRLNFSVITDYEKTSDDKKTFDRNGQDMEYDVFNESLSNFDSFNSFGVNPKVGFSMSIKKLDLSASAGISVIRTENHAFYLNETIDLNKNYFIPNGTISANYSISQSQSVLMMYERKYTIPSGNQVLAVADLDNPLVVRTGNPNLKASTFHFLQTGFSSYNFESDSGYFLHFSTTYFDNQIVGASDYNSSGKQISTFDNVEGTYDMLLAGEWNKRIKKDVNTFGLRFSLYANYNLNKGFTNNQLYEAKAFRLNPGFGFTYEYGELLNIQPYYNFTYNDIRYNNTSLSSTSNTTHNFNVEITNFWPKNWVFGNDFGYNYNSNISGPYKRDFYLWNTSLSYKFAKQFTFKVKVYDLLNQNQSTSRTITSTAVVDSESNVLKRYVMFSLLYKFKNFVTNES
ncbi:outer membrane beta-barrel protein [Flavobacterium johnsoniae]|uniref:Outer membrane receptor proteins, mostly Fe transport n=1 Tax=Flavobacterium johnsoniae TaxID=986 RepID=A0A1M5KUY8_FLAJO|nr:outer membrane beta-barrel protein [Flavobacterium johnsoniae]SHG56662.1 Outer membrane receptor proteins, mostly Fe transport [Flavobacterium johnsoniae]